MSDDARHERERQENVLHELNEFELSAAGRLWFEFVRNQFRIINRLDIIVEQNRKIMADQAALDAQIQKVTSDLATSLSSGIQSIITAIQEKGAGVPVDFTPEINSLQSLDDSINAIPNQIAQALASANATAPTSGGDVSGSAPVAEVARKQV